MKLIMSYDTLKLLNLVLWWIYDIISNLYLVRLWSSSWRLSNYSLGLEQDKLVSIIKVPIDKLKQWSFHNILTNIAPNIHLVTQNTQLIRYTILSLVINPKYVHQSMQAWLFPSIHTESKLVVGDWCEFINKLLRVFVHFSWSLWPNIRQSHYLQLLSEFLYEYKYL